MSQVSWYPANPRSRMNFFLKSFPIFIALVIFLYFGLDWLGAFEFLELLVRENSAWIMNVVFGMSYEDFVRGYSERRDSDLLTGGIVYFGEDFPSINLDGYPITLLIIRACTGMEAGALLMALILVTPAKWYQKSIAQVVNLLMMHIGNTFRVAFHFWFTDYLFKGGMDAQTSFFWAHDMLSKVFGFVGIVIFTLVIERTGVQIVSTFGAWMDAIGEGIKRLTWRIEGRSFYSKLKTIDSFESEQLVDTEIIESKVPKSNAEKVYFYPTKELKNNKWKFTGKTFGIFAIVSTALLMLGFIPGFSNFIAGSSDTIAVNWFGAVRESFNKFGLWWISIFDIADFVQFKVGLFGTGLGLVAFMIGLVIATPGEWKKKVWATIITISIFPLHIFTLGLQKYWVYSLAANAAFRINHPLLYINFADILVNTLPVVFWLLGFTLLMLIYHALDIKAFYLIYAWLHKIYFVFLQIVGIRKTQVKDEIFKDEIAEETEFSEVTKQDEKEPSETLSS